MSNEFINIFTRLYLEDYELIKSSCDKLDQSDLWKTTPEGVSVANLICHVCEMEAFWIDHGLCGNEFERNRQIEFERKNNLTKDALLERINKRNQKTLSMIKNLSDDQWNKNRQFHGDDFTGKGILLWHIHHIGLHRGHIEAHTRWVKSVV